MYNKILDFVESKIDGFERPIVLVDYLNNEFTYGIESRNIYVPEKITATSKRWWISFMTDYILDEFDIMLDLEDNLVFSFLHELGHYVTLTGIDSHTVNYKYNKYQMKLDPKDENYEYKYRKNPIEQMADLWAIDFINEYPEVLEIVKINLI